MSEVGKVLYNDLALYSYICGTDPQNVLVSEFDGQLNVSVVAHGIPSIQVLGVVKRRHLCFIFQGVISGLVVLALRSVIGFRPKISGARSVKGSLWRRPA